MIDLQNLLDDAKCYEMVRQLRWPTGVRCPHCESAEITDLFRNLILAGLCYRERR
ncbi:MAG: transposase [Candidatus Competibacter sp.]